MKKIITVLSVVVLVGCIAVVFYGCGGKDEDITTTTETTSTTLTTDIPRNDGVVTDVSEPGDNGALGDLVTDVSEGLSDMATDISRDVSDMER